MKINRAFSLLLSLVLVLGLLSGCGGNTPAVTDTSATAEELIAAMDISEAWKQELLYAAELGFPLDNLQQETISGKEMAELLDKLVEYAAPEKLEEWKTLYPAFRSSTRPLLRIDALSVLFLAVQHIGGDYANYKVDQSDPMFEIIFADIDAPTFDLFGGVINFDLEGWGNDHYGIGGYIYNLTRKSPMDGEYPMAYDAERASFRMNEATTYMEGLLAVIRAIRLGKTKAIVSVDDPAATQLNSRILTEALLAKAAANPVVTSEDHPVWTGFALGYGYRGEFGTSSKELALTAEWGFNSARVALHYATLFSNDVTTVDLNMLYKLDEMVATAIEHDIHLNIMLSMLPGRDAYMDSDFVSTADLDLFTNPEKQDMADPIFRVLAQRYKDVPNYNLSISPLWEPTNYNLSTGLPMAHYTPDDVAAYLGRVIDVIRAEDPDRLIIYEASNANAEDLIIEESTPTKAVADSNGNVMITYNFCQNAYVYACMTETAGKHIDNMNSSMYVPEYPNYIQFVPYHICGGQEANDLAIIMDGLLPAGTELTLQIKSSIGGTLDISADGVSLYREELTAATYETGETLSGFYPYAESEKQVSATLPADADELVISCKNGAFDICGMTLNLPEEYAVERWFYVQPYDEYTGAEDETGVVLKSTSEVLIAPNDFDRGNLITIHDDLSFTSKYTGDQTYLYYDVASRETIDAWSETIDDFDGNCVIRFERADFSGATWGSMSAYYEDLLQSFTEHGFSWWSNDWWLMTEEYPQTKVIAECPSIEYAGYDYFNLELLQLLQKYQSKE